MQSTYRLSNLQALQPPVAHQGHQWTTHSHHAFPYYPAYPQTSCSVSLRLAKACSLVKAVKGRVGSRRLTGSRTATRIGALQFGIEALEQRLATEVASAHSEHAVDLLWVCWEILWIEGRGIACRREVVLVACDPAPWLSQTPTMLVRVMYVGQ